MSELSMAELAAAEAGLPSDLTEFITGADADSCEAQAKKLASFVNRGGFPQVKDSGESGVNNTITKADILAIKSEKKRLAAIRDNIDLFR